MNYKDKQRISNLVKTIAGDIQKVSHWQILMAERVDEIERVLNIEEGAEKAIERLKERLKAEAKTEETTTTEATPGE